ncbi:Cytochrome c [Thelohanellus kitauei]|uniref:Cytochrome c n=1 Tax=Thelohanellus kitauei TaxID=669202 RepID=A0A0C2N6B1_THEKT|nr:Cytochrome c [Thelohanellus kitauei]
MVEKWEKGDEKAGAKIFKERCSQCHNIIPGGSNKQGPNLYNVFGRLSGQVKGFAYSKANAEAKVEWNGPNLFDYLQNPAKFMPGNKMNFAGLKNDKALRDIIAFLMKKRD